MKFDFNENIIIVTGSARGIGYTIAEEYSKFGAHVIIADIDSIGGFNSAENIRKQGHLCSFKYIDLNKPETFDNFISDILTDFKRIDILVNNARAGKKANLITETIENWNLTNNVIMSSAFFLSQILIRKKKETKITSILNISSIAGILATPESPSYHVAKAALIALTKYLAVEAAKYGIRVNCILPGFIVQKEHVKRYNSVENNSYKKLSENYQPLGKVGSENDVAQASLFLTSSNSCYINGVSLILDGGATLQEQFGLSLKITNFE